MQNNVGDMLGVSHTWAMSQFTNCYQTLYLLPWGHEFAGEWHNNDAGQTWTCKLPVNIFFKT